MQKIISGNIKREKSCGAVQEIHEGIKMGKLSLIRTFFAGKYMKLDLL